MGQHIVHMPDIGEGVAEGEIVEWLKNTGDDVAQDEPVVTVMTDKATVELPAPKPGKLAQQHYKVGEKAPVGKPLYELEVAGEDEAPAKETITKKSSAPKKQKVETSTATLALPKTRKKASEMGISIDRITPTGIHGEVTEADLVQSRGRAPTRLSGDHETPILGIKNIMAERMAESKQHIPHFSYFEQTDATRLVQLRLNVKTAAANEGINATYMPFLIRALSLTLEKFPILNSSIDPEKNTLIEHSHHNIGIAITTPSGLIVPTLKDVQDLKLQDIIRQYDQLKKRALESKLSSQDMKEATITISNYGVLGGGGRWATPIINPPEVAILAVARIQKQPIVKNETIAIRDTLNLSWSFDHRVIDGEIAANASHFFSTLIANPAPLL